MTDKLIDALKSVASYSKKTVITGSKDIMDWSDDVAFLGKLAIEALAAHEAIAQKPLTDEQIDELIDDGTFSESRKTIVRSIEAMHGITRATP